MLRRSGLGCAPLAGRKVRRRHADIAQEVRPFRHPAVVDFPPRDHAPAYDARTTFATSRRRVASTGKHSITRPRLRIRRRRWATHFFPRIPAQDASSAEKKSIEYIVFLNKWRRYPVRENADKPECAARGEAAEKLLYLRCFAFDVRNA